MTDDIIFVLSITIWLTLVNVAFYVSTLPIPVMQDTNQRIVPVYHNPGEDSEIELEPIEGVDDEERYDFRW